MNDLLEKVMNGLQCKITAHYDTCKDCPYFSEELAEDYPEFEYFCNRSQIEADALELLKEQQSAYERGKRDGVSQYLRDREEDEEYEY